VSDPFEFIELRVFAGLPRPFIEPDGYFDAAA
jgi:hypothetical protein